MVGWEVMRGQDTLYRGQDTDIGAPGGANGVRDG